MTRWTTVVAVVLLAGSPVALGQEGAEDAAGEPGDRPSARPVFRTDPRAQPEADAQPTAVRSPDAVAVLEGVREALKDGFSATMRSYFEGESTLGTTVFATSEGRWAQGGLGADGAWAARYTGLGTPPMSGDQLEVDILWKADRVVWLDGEARTLNTQPLTSGRKTGSAFQVANNCWDRAEMLADGFAGMLQTAAAIEAGEIAEVEGVPCDVVRIIRRAGNDPVLWYFGRSDHLPRRCEIVLPDTPVISGAMRVDFTDGQAGAGAVRESDWAIALPEGFTEETSVRLRGLPAPDSDGLSLPPVRANPDAGLPEWSVTDSDGALVSPSTLRGKVSVLYFWGTWSPACKKTAPEVKALAEHYAGQPVEVIGMAFREGDVSALVEAAHAQGQTWRQVPDAGDAVEVVGVRAAPTIVVLGKGGELLYKSGRPGGDYGEMFEKIRAIIDQAIAEEAPPESRARPAVEGASENLEARRATRLGQPRDRQKDE